MKSIKYLFMMLAMMAMCVNLTSCGGGGGGTTTQEPPIIEDPEPTPEFSLVGTSWSYTDRFEEDDIKYTDELTINFSSSTRAKLTQVTTVTEGSQTTSQSFYIDYTYTHHDDLVIMSPVDANYAYLEGEITSEIKMEVINASSGLTIGVFYRN